MSRRSDNTQLCLFPLWHDHTAFRARSVTEITDDEGYQIKEDSDLSDEAKTAGILDESTTTSDAELCDEVAPGMVAFDAGRTVRSVTL